ncbi:cytochrome c biogenesis CcdA family protein [Nocardia rhizosphaerae]|uniref:Cytochrome c biogenesis CcdA family protein n=1 Tax=Nocardia rhizosphaerae TaxID=1691571 RepID=A0ABV8L6H0_9NOCA
MNSQTLGFALAAGLVAALNPCGFALLPGYLSLVVFGTDGVRTRTAALGRALAATGAMAAGFLLVFGMFGLVIAPLTSAVQRYLPAITVLIGIALIGLGAWLLTGRELTVLLPKSGRGAPTARLGSMAGYGVAYAIASLSCTIGPFLAVTSSTFRSGSVLGGVAAYLAYAAGMALLVGTLAIIVALAGAGAMTTMRRVLPHVSRISGVLMVLAGLYVAYYGVYELRLFFGDGSADDPVVDGAGQVQQVLQRWVDELGAGVLFGVGVLLIAAVVGVGAYRRRRAAQVERRLDSTDLAE